MWDYLDAFVCLLGVALVVWVNVDGWKKFKRHHGIDE